MGGGGGGGWWVEGHLTNEQTGRKKRSLTGHAYRKQQCAASFNWSAHFELKRLENLCEHGSHSPSIRLFGCRLHRGRTCRANEANQAVGCLFSVGVPSLFPTGAKSHSFSRKDISKKIEADN